jgi:hypothetical protein
MPRAALLMVLLAAGCSSSFDVWVQPPPIPKPEPPLPPPFEGEQAPALEATTVQGILVAPPEFENLYYSEPDGLWYRYWRSRWYQAFRWNGNWFPPEDVPAPLRAGPLEVSSTPP